MALIIRQLLASSFLPYLTAISINIPGKLSMPSFGGTVLCLRSLCFPDEDSRHLFGYQEHENIIDELWFVLDCMVLLVSFV